MTPTLKELLGRATPGNWIHLLGERIVFTRLNDGCRGVPVVAAEYEYLPHAQGNLALIARCSPANMALVLSALEDSQNALKDYITDAEARGGSMNYGKSVMARNADALAALNGTALNKP